MTSLCKVAKE
nr:hypothetical protein [Tanacetum cinerariifolium]